MIAVIADDFTGAAEIGGVGLRYGLKVLIETEVNKVEDVDLLVIATDTRSMSATDASAEVARITSQLLALEPVLIFKKIDSVLRGHVAAEIETQLRLMGKKKALIVPANPLIGRTIVNGQYFVDSVPLNETSFSDDPEFPIHSANVTEIVQSSEFPVVSMGLNEKLPGRGLIIANIRVPEELKVWTCFIDSDMVVAGGSVFFDALLGTVFSPKVSVAKTDLSFGESSLFIFGSKYPKQPSLLEKFYKNKVVRSNMPEGIYYNTGLCDDLLECWAGEVTCLLKSGKTVMVTIDHQPVNEEGLSLRLCENIGKLVEKVARRIELRDLFIEGGATTSTVLKYLNINKLMPFNEADFGVIQMKVEGFPNLCITTKPGSYLWPGHLKFAKPILNT